MAFRKAPSLAIVIYKRIREPATEQMIPRVAKTWVERNQAEKTERKKGFNMLFIEFISIDISWTGLTLA